MLYRFVFILYVLLATGCNSSISQESEKVLPGAYQLKDYLPIISNRNVGIVANWGSVIENYHLVDTLLSKSIQDNYPFRMKCIFSPEHGFSGNFGAGALIESESSEFDSIPIISLYGQNRKPKVQDISGIDVILFDLQDVGARFYTYISTLHYVMQACAENNIKLIVLDRPNPHINYVDGPVLEKEYTSFVGMHQVPVIYGMTIGEYAKMINGEWWLGDSLICDLKVIPVKNYNRTDYYQFPVKPSPNLPNMESILLYPSLCFFEGTVVSIGRGTPTPFQVIGHPDFPDSTFNFKPVSTPGASLYPKLEGEVCYGYNLSNIPIEQLRQSNFLDLKYLLEFYSTLKMNKEFFTEYFDVLAGTNKLRNQILDGSTLKEIRESWQQDLSEFREIRKKYLIYKEH